MITAVFNDFDSLDLDGVMDALCLEINELDERESELLEKLLSMDLSEKESEFGMEIRKEFEDVHHRILLLVSVRKAVRELRYYDSSNADAVLDQASKLYEAAVAVASDELNKRGSVISTEKFLSDVLEHNRNIWLHDDDDPFGTIPYYDIQPYDDHLFELRLHWDW